MGRGPGGGAPCGALGAVVLWPRSGGIPVACTRDLRSSLGEQQPPTWSAPACSALGFLGPSRCRPPTLRGRGGVPSLGLSLEATRLEESGGERGADSGRGRTRWDGSAGVFPPAPASLQQGPGSPREKPGEPVPSSPSDRGSAACPGLQTLPDVFKT